MIITRTLVDRLNSDPSKSVKLQFKFLLETNSSLIGQFLNWYMIYMLNKVHKYLKKSSTNYFLLKIFQTIFLMNGQTTLSQGCQGFYKQVKWLCPYVPSHNPQGNCLLGPGPTSSIPPTLLLLCCIPYQIEFSVNSYMKGKWNLWAGGSPCELPLIHTI